ncbi:T9SS type A sorting domain-containing protein [Lewinella sp. IMCC34191]|uniref:T9SS type A sorting domain-containing protein n=1 Tax=Lewinella sp. IMCC34191 TaxID=2259172 RepID=UPI0013008BB6|nr:T9SS type A sorting domain-containing protein [Lewinella sp. IMCC34191]
MADFEDLRDVEVNIGPGTIPLFKLSTLTNKHTRFDFKESFDTYEAMATSDRAQLVLSVFEVGVNWYNFFLSLCPGDCTILFPSFSSVAPVTLIAWSTTPQRNHVELSWETAEELDNSHFMVSRSTDGVNFTEIASIGGQGTTETTSTYHYRDQKPHRGTNYYRLDQYDYDGTMETLGVQYVEWEVEASPDAIVLSPNPVASGQRISLGVELTKPAEAIIFNADGRLVASLMLESSSFRVPSLKPGVYTVRINESTNRLVVAR